MTKKLTKAQLRVLECIKQYIAENEYGPTVRDICDMTGHSSPSTVHMHLKSLEEKGLINRDSKKSRSITLPHTDKPSKGVSDDLSAQKLICIPIVGNVAAGEPILAEQNITDMMYLPTDIVSDSASFMLNVRGDSMVGIGINDGDYVVVKEQQTANNGDIVVAIIDEGATVKRFFREDGYIRLQPENHSMQPIIVSECTIAGKVVAVFRRL